MCGIVGYAGTRECGDILIDGLRRLEYRGYDSAGVAIHTTNGVERVRAEGKLANLERAFRDTPLHGTVGIGHTRWATHGRPSEANAHPHMVDGFVVVHNGIIENHMELRDELEAGGDRFESETDTEIIAHLVARERPKTDSLLEAVRNTMAQVRGSYAVVVMNADEPDLMVAARQASPLIVGLGDGENFAASDVPAIMMHTRDVVFMNDGDFAVIRRDSVEFSDTSGAPVTHTAKRILWDPVSAEKQGYKHFMLKEIHEQPDRIIDTMRGRVSLETNHVHFPDMALDDEVLSSVKRIIILACGTSYHAGMVGRYAIEKLARVPVEVDLASEFRYRDPVIGEGTLIVAISQSGETADTLAAVAEAKRRGAKAIAICNVIESTLTRVCEGTIYTHAGPEIGVASTKAFTTQLVALYLLAIWLAQERGTQEPAERIELLEGLRRIPGQIEKCIQDEARIREFARNYVDVHSFLFLGRGMQFPIALEGALKLKEISYIHAEGYAAGEMKHGPIALIDDDLPVVVVAPRNEHYEKVLSNLEEVKARGGRVIAVTSEPAGDVLRHADDVMTIPEVPELLQPLVTVIPLQLLSYCIADIKGTDIDQPRNLAKSVTVE